MRVGRRSAMLLGCALLGLAGTVQAQSPRSDPPAASPQPYAGQQSRAISTLSAEDVAELERGGGWGLAKPAELNGYPGPLHVLELADRLELTAMQRERVERIFKRMQLRARSIGKRYVAAEAAIDHVFRSGAAYKGGVLQTHLRDAERLRAELRGVHLQAHVETTPVLTEAQRLRYVELRGYGGGDASHGHGDHQHRH